MVPKKERRANSCYDNYCRGAVNPSVVAYTPACHARHSSTKPPGSPTVDPAPPAARTHEDRVMITADLLTRIPLFAGLPAEERASLAARAADVHIREDEWLLMEGQSPAFFGLLEGRLAVIKSIAGRDHHVATYEPGEYFGEVPLLLGSPAVAGLRALEPSRVMRLEPADFHDLVSHCRVLNAEIMKTMERRVSHLKQVVADSQTVAATVIGTHRDVRCLDLREFLARNHVTVAWRDLDDPDALERLVYDGFVPSVGALMTPECVAIRSSKLPLVVLENSDRLEAPSLRDTANAVGL